MGFRPRPPEGNVETTLIYFRSGPGYDEPLGVGNWKAWTDNLNDYMKGESKDGPSFLWNIFMTHSVHFVGSYILFLCFHENLENVLLNGMGVLRRGK